MDHLSYLADIANVFLAVAVEQLEGTPGGVPAFAGIGHATPPDDCCDFVNVVYTGFRVVQPGTLAAPLTGTPFERCQDAKFSAQFAVTVARSGAPTVKPSRRQPIPSAQVEHDFAVFLLADAACLMHHIMPVAAAEVKERVDWAWIGIPMFEAGQLIPFNLGGCAGWSAGAQLTLPLTTPQVP